MLMWRQVAVRGGIPASASVTSFAAVYGASACGDDVGELDGLWEPHEGNAGAQRCLSLQTTLKQAMMCTLWRAGGACQVAA